MVTIKNNLVTLNKSAKLSPKQLHRMSLFHSESERIQYALSCIGLHKSRVDVTKPSKHYINSADKLSNKSKNATLNTLNRLLDNGSSKLHVPLSRDSKSQWIGVEIECLFDGSENSCDSCSGSGEHTCYNCDGDGHINSEDSNGHTYRNDCAVCEGSGNVSCDDCNGSSDDSSTIQASIRRKLTLNKITHCSVKSDGSLSADDKVGVEVTVLFNASNGYDKLYKVCKILNDLGASINDTCGLHVHIDQFNYSDSDKLLHGQNLASYLPIMAKLVPESRRNNHYCKLSRNEPNDSCRYHAINMTSLDKHDTIEVRLHSGTTNANKIEQWVRLLLAINSLKTRNNFKTDSIKGIEQTLNLPAKTIEYLKGRYNKFNDYDEDNEEQGEDLEGLGVESYSTRVEQIQTEWQDYTMAQASGWALSGTTPSAVTINLTNGEVI